MKSPNPGPFETYLDPLANRIWKMAGGVSSAPPGDYVLLFRLYALLALSVGEFVTNEHVHDAWSIWRAQTDPKHRSLVPFHQLTKKVQDLDDPYRDAIIRAARGEIC